MDEEEKEGGRIGSGAAFAGDKSEGNKVNKKQYQEYLKYRDKYSLYIKLRKWTVPFHWACGALCAVLFVDCWPLAVVLMALLAWLEWWNDQNLKENLGDIYKKEGDQDWWDCLVPFIGGIAVARILDWIGLITIRWWF